MKEDKNITLQFLDLISYHLSSRKDMRMLEYSVVIDDNRKVHMDPAVNVFPNQHDRSPYKKVSVVEHIFLYHLNYYEFVQKADPGTYIYQLSSTKKKRRWVSKNLIV